MLTISGGDALIVSVAAVQVSLLGGWAITGCEGPPSLPQDQLRLLIICVNLD